MDTPLASRPSRRPLGIALLALLVLFGLVACSSSDSSSDSDSSSSTAPASEDAATNDVASSPEVNLQFQVDVSELEQRLEQGNQLVVSRTVQNNSGENVEVIWLAINPLETNSVSYDPAELQVFASDTELFPGATIQTGTTTGAGDGDTATWNEDGSFQVTPGSSGSVTIVANSGVSVFGLLGSATVNSSQVSAPYAAANGEPMEEIQFTDTGRISVWWSTTPVQPGTVTSIPQTATTIDTSSDPSASYTFDTVSQRFVQG